MHSRHLYDDFIRRKPRRTSDGKQFSGTLRKCGTLRVQTSQYMYCLHFKTAVRKKQYTLPKIPRITPERQGQASHASICAAVKAFQADKYLVKIDGFSALFRKNMKMNCFSSEYSARPKRLLSLLRIYHLISGTWEKRWFFWLTGFVI